MMPRYVNPREWCPIDDLVLEPVALEVTKSTTNCFVVAGPGAGKTELLAQRASFLLQTGACVHPRKVLALSYKKDAARNLGERVEKRVGRELSKQFISMTYDALAKGLVDHFTNAIPGDYRPAAGYHILNIIPAYKRFCPTRRIDKSTKEALNTHFVIDISSLPISEDSSVGKRILELWKLFLAGDGESPSCLSFPMIAVLAEYLMRENPKIRKALAITYSHIFLDEFQDTTKAQYRLVRTCFAGRDAVLTAVGDYKQRIMIWAGADEEIFKKFQSDFTACERQLLMNHRSAPRLIQVQRSLMGLSLKIEASKKQNVQDGIAQVWLFNNAQQEAKILAQSLKTWLSEDKLSPRDVCVIVRQRPEQYGSILIKEFQDQAAISARNENEFQDLLSEECIRIILDFVLLAFSKNSPEACLNTIGILNLLRGVDASVENLKKLRQIDEELELFLTQLKQSFSNSDSISALVVGFWEILSYLDVNTLKNVFSQYKQGDYLDSLLNKLGELLWQEYQNYGNWEQAVRALFGEYSIPIMTIHKSKGLEYDTVVFLGLEDSAFWNYPKQQNEETCAFFVALSRAERRVIFTFSEHRCTQKYPKQKTGTIRSFYQALDNSQVVDVMDFRQDH